jgi:hypothetical protein
MNSRNHADKQSGDGMKLAVNINRNDTVETNDVVAWKSNDRYMTQSVASRVARKGRL